MNVSPSDGLEDEIREIIVHALKLEDVSPSSIDIEESLFEGELGLDSIDALEIGVALRKRYGIKIEANSEDVKAHFRNIKNLATFVRIKRGLK